VLVPRYKLSLCHTPIKPDLLGFPGIDVFACGLRDHVITRFASTILSIFSSIYLANTTKLSSHLQRKKKKILNITNMKRLIGTFRYRGWGV
jgi:hypothetical protein